MKTVPGPSLTVLVNRIRARERVLVKAALAWDRDPCDVTEDRLQHAARCRAVLEELAGPRAEPAPEPAPEKPKSNPTEQLALFRILRGAA